jgi:ABC-type branched-subunit amino acid transport system substrate-binding protein
VRPAIPWFSRKVIARSTVTLLSVGVLAACSGGSSSSGTTPSSHSDAPIVIGASLSETGPFSADGLAFKKGYNLWARDVNAHGGLLGRKVELTIADDGSSANQVVTNYQELFGSDHVDLAFGPFSSVLTEPASSVAARFGMAFVEGAGGAPSVFDTPSNQADHNVFDVSLPVADELVPFVNWIAKLPGERPKTAAYPMAQEYVAQYGGGASDVNADVAEAYSVGQVMAQAVTATGGTDNTKIISYLHSGVTLDTVQGPVTFDSLGENGSAAAFVFQWQLGDFKEVLPVGAPGSVPILATKPAWASSLANS